MLTNNQRVKIKERIAAAILAPVLLISLLGSGCDSTQAQSYTAPVQPTSGYVQEAPAKQDVVAAPVDSNDAEAVAPVVQKKEDPKPALQPAEVPSSAPNGTYTNVYGNEVPSPYQAPSKPVGTCAQCGDGTYSVSQSRRGTCSHHGGEAEWY